ncbi:hypothetical protein HNY73_012548 [Argiope bruennichi]|uniref:Uncharacterized protein n=1 Tax=Argiope bruennichi TaxID=94029 RepID=A0A8T0EV89_ARGBR|nr:hypothetical protein HNY73_012548 [Argiope bruennichi]
MNLYGRDLSSTLVEREEKGGTPSNRNSAAEERVNWFAVRIGECSRLVIKYGLGLSIVRSEPISMRLQGMEMGLVGHES